MNYVRKIIIVPAVVLLSILYSYSYVSAGDEHKGKEFIEKAERIIGHLGEWWRNHKNKFDGDDKELGEIIGDIKQWLDRCEELKNNPRIEARDTIMSKYDELNKLYKDLDKKMNDWEKRKGREEEDKRKRDEAKKKLEEGKANPPKDVEKDKVVQEKEDKDELVKMAHRMLEGHHCEICCDDLKCEEHHKGQKEVKPSPDKDKRGKDIDKLPRDLDKKDIKNNIPDKLTDKEVANFLKVIRIILDEKGIKDAPLGDRAVQNIRDTEEREGKNFSNAIREYLNRVRELTDFDEEEIRELAHDDEFKKESRKLFYKALHNK